MIYIDFALRGGAITIMLILAVLIWRAPFGSQGRWSIVAVSVTQSAFLITNASVPFDFSPALHANLVLLASLTPAATTWLIVTIFLDAPGLRWPWIAASLATSMALFAHSMVPGSFPLCAFMGAALYGALLALALWSSRDDLVECRCRARPGFAAAIAGFALFLTAGQATGLLREGSSLLAFSQSIGTFVVAVAFAFWLLRPDQNKWPGEMIPVTTANLLAPDTSADNVLIGRIETAMSAGIWREEGLTIGALANKLSVPEHKLRRTINHGLGYRNFSSFINQARIEAACSTLGDPEQANVTVLEIAYDVGFSSIGPFNRAFRAAIGHNPTEYRRLVQAGGIAKSEKFSPITEKFH